MPSAVAIFISNDYRRRRCVITAAAVYVTAAVFTVSTAAVSTASAVITAAAVYVTATVFTVIAAAASIIAVTAAAVSTASTATAVVSVYSASASDKSPHSVSSVRPWSYHPLAPFPQSVTNT
jgi:hypothetical protein